MSTRVPIPVHMEEGGGERGKERSLHSSCQGETKELCIESQIRKHTNVSGNGTTIFVEEESMPPQLDNTDRTVLLEIHRVPTRNILECAHVKELKQKTKLEVRRNSLVLVLPLHPLLPV